MTLDKNRLVAPIVTVFGKKHYLLLALAATILFWIILNVLDQLLFFWPIITFYLPEGKIAGFILSNLTAGTMGILTSMNTYALKNARAFSRSSVIPGSALGIASIACAGCSSFGVFLASTLGTAGAAGVAFFAVYQMPLRILSFVVLAWAYYSVQKIIITSSGQKSDRSDNEDGAKINRN